MMMFGTVRRLPRLICAQEATVAHYEIRIQSSDGVRSITWDLEQADDMAALNSALELCRNQTIEVWDGKRHVGAISISGSPRLTL
jgi:hypothetical protein